ncbi:MAG TPA: rhomboid family intramembrane serine protease [Cyclobacteriaceae bacterium]
MQLIIINVVIFLALAVVYVFSSVAQHKEVFVMVLKQLALPADFSLFITKPWTLITHAFVHDMGSILHILFNMLILYWFGQLIVEYLGNDKLIALYVMGILAGATAILLTHNLIPFYIEQNGALAFGASAAVNAVVVGAATLLPDYTFYLLLLGPVRIKWIAAFYVVASFIGSVGANAGGDVAHLGGALMGFIYVKQLQVGVNWGGWVTSTLDWIKDLFKPSSKVKVTYRKSEPARKTTQARQNFNKATQEEIDAILDKISDKGYESLTKEEKEKLFNASKK